MWQHVDSKYCFHTRIDSFFQFAICSLRDPTCNHTGLLSSRPNYTPCLLVALCIAGQCHDDENNKNRMSCWCSEEVKSMNQLTNCLLFVPVTELRVVFSLFMNRSKVGMEINLDRPLKVIQVQLSCSASGWGCHVFQAKPKRRRHLSNRSSCESTLGKFTTWLEVKREKPKSDHLVDFKLETKQRQKKPNSPGLCWAITTPHLLGNASGKSFI